MRDFFAVQNYDIFCENNVRDFFAVQNYDILCGNNVRDFLRCKKSSHFSAKLSVHLIICVHNRFDESLANDSVSRMKL